MEFGTVFDIQHFCLDDGPGIRTTVFLKGCPLRCIWCHNAEGLNRKKQLSFSAKNCRLCGKCAEICPQSCHRIECEKLPESGEAEWVHAIDREKCKACGACEEICPAEALRIYGKEMSSVEVLEDVEKDRLFYETSEGGMTLSGGEPLCQSAFAVELLMLAKQRGIHTCVETSGYCPAEVMQEAAVYTDLFLFDIKETDSVLHKEFTGVDSEQIRKNLRLLAKLGKNVILRCPVIPGCNDREAHFISVAQLADSLGNVSEIHLEPYHPFGLDKYEKFGLEASYKNAAFMEEQEIQKWLEFVKSHTGVYVKIS